MHGLEVELCARALLVPNVTQTLQLEGKGEKGRKKGWLSHQQKSLPMRIPHNNAISLCRYMRETAWRNSMKKQHESNKGKIPWQGLWKTLPWQLGWKGAKLSMKRWSTTLQAEGPLQTNRLRHLRHCAARLRERIFCYESDLAQEQEPRKARKSPSSETPKHDWTRSWATPPTLESTLPRVWG